MAAPPPANALPLSARIGFTEADVVSFNRAMLNSTILEILFFVLYTCIYARALYEMTSRDRRLNRTTITHLCIITLIWLLTFIRTSILWLFLDVTYITHGETRETVFDYNLFNNVDKLIIATRVMMAINVFLADSFIIWRCWVIFNRSLLMVVLPTIFLIFGTTSVILFFYQSALNFSPGVEPGQANLAMIYYGMTIGATVATNLYCTTVIVVRIIRTTGIRTYKCVIEVLVESAMLYSVAYLVYLAFYAYTFNSNGHNSNAFYPAAVLSAVTGIAPTLIIARISTRALISDTMRLESHSDSRVETDVLDISREKREAIV